MLPSVLGVGYLPDDQLLRLQGELGKARRHVDARAAVVASEIARRSDRALGQQGLAARSGESVSGIGQPSSAVSSIELLEVATTLVSRAANAAPEDMAKAARIARARLDAGSVAGLEAHRLSKRTLTWFENSDGMTRLSALLDPESAAVIVGALTTALSPRRGGPRFLDPLEVQRAQRMLDDTRTNDQLAVDTLVEIVQLATRTAGSTAVFGHKSPAVRVHVQAEALETGAGIAHVEGQSAPVSIQTAQRHICISGILPILFNGNTPIDVGRTQRLHSVRQRAAITARWNGCAWGECDKPPQYAEAHHIAAFDGENTTLANGISLCRFHHMQLHASGWVIDARADGTYWLTPPSNVAAQVGLHAEPFEMHSKSPLHRTA